MSERIEEKYLFCWDEIPGKDSDKLVEFLRDWDVKWVKKAKIEKVDNGNTIKIFNEKKSILLKLNNERTGASLPIDDDEIYELIVKEENGKLNIYEEIEITEITVTEEDLPKLKRVPMGTEEDLIKFIRESEIDKRFWQEILEDKIQREKEAWNLLYANIGKVDQDILNEVFDKIDKSEKYTWRWWGQLLNKPNTDKIFSTPNDKLNNWFNYLLNGNESELLRIEKCIVDPKYKLNGVNKGLVTLLLYLKNPNSFNVMMDPTIEGLERLGKFVSKKGKRSWSIYYNDYNTAVKEFRDRFKLKPQSIDYVLDRINRLRIHRAEDGTFIRYEYEENNKEITGDKQIHENIVHVTNDLIEKASDELGIINGEATKIELITTLRKIVERDGNKLVDDETAWKEILNLLKEVRDAKEFFS